jgi:O-antigen ligase
MPLPSEITSPPTQSTGELAVAAKHLLADPADWPVAMLGLMMFVLPAVGVPNELMLQDTLKSAIAAFGILIAALLFFWQQRHRTEPVLWHGMVWLPVVLMLYALGSMVWSHTYLAGVEAIRWFLLSLLMWLGLNTFTRQNLPLLLWGIHAGAVVASLWVVLQFWFDLKLFPQGPNPASTFYNRNFFAEYAVSTLPISIYLLAKLRTPAGWFGPMAFSLALNLVALMMTGTRSALIVMMVLTPTMALILIRYRQQLAFTQWGVGNQSVVGLVLVVGVLGLGSIPAGNVQIIQEKSGMTALQRSFLRATSLTESAEYTERSFSIRATMWKATARMAFANPWTGVGAGAWEVQIPRYQRVGTFRETDYYAHNEFLQLLSEYGAIVGGLFIAFLLGYFLIAAGKTWRLGGANVDEAPLRAFVLASVLATLIVSNAGFAWRLASTGAMLMLSLSLLAQSDARLSIQERFFARQLPWRPALTRVILALLVCSTVLAVLITRQAAEVERKLTRSLLYLTTSATPDFLTQTGAPSRHAELLRDVHDAITINPHYRKLSPVVADHLAMRGDWENAVWIWESAVASRPYVAAFWYNLTKGYLHLEQFQNAEMALKKLVLIQADAPGAKALEVILLSRTGHTAQAVQMLTEYYDRVAYDYDLVVAGFDIGREIHNWPLAIRALELRIQTWPQEAADAYFKLGHIYAETEVADESKARAAFSAGMLAAPAESKQKYRQQVPRKYQPDL